MIMKLKEEARAHGGSRAREKKKQIDWYLQDFESPCGIKEDGNVNVPSHILPS
jgi:hypothetical protein